MFSSHMLWNKKTKQKTKLLEKTSTASLGVHYRSNEVFFSDVEILLLACLEIYSNVLRDQDPRPNSKKVRN